MHHLYTDILLGVLLAALIGLERGWETRGEDEGKRIAGIRTFTVIGMFASLSSLLAMKIGVLFIIAAFIGFAAFVISVYRIPEENKDVGITTEVSMLTVFVISSLAVYGYRYVASASAVILMGILSFKPQIHAFVKKISMEELVAVFKFLILVAVIYPLLPDIPPGNWTTLTYADFFKIVIIVAGISFMAYLAIRILGAKRGIMLSSLLGGLVSSTGVTLSLSRYYKENGGEPRYYALGILISWFIMFIRVIIIVCIFNVGLIAMLGIPIVAFMLFMGSYIFIFKKRIDEVPGFEIQIKNPIDIVASLKFAIILTVTFFIAEMGKKYAGEYGLLVISFFSGIADVDSITIYLSNLSRDPSFSRVAIFGIIIASITNTILKCIIACFIGGKKIGAPLVKITALLIALCLLIIIGLVYVIDIT